MSALFRQTIIIVICLFILVMSWEGQKVDAAVPGWVQQSARIPHESIRLRILANSDLPEDQLIKLEVRDAVVAEMNTWIDEMEQPQSLEEARSMVQARLPEISEAVGKELARRGMTYTYKVELGQVPFPTKIYGSRVYPAGQYEAVRITLGEGAGKNWWCVLFPPLCFVGANSPQEAEKTSAGSEKTAQGGNNGEQVEARFYLVDKAVDVWDWVSGLFV
ncbi:stage II sporulation protein R [Paenibacillus sp. P96]|uniref:Stage II sporulation protein R n=1 Tax=Paenibacillus zeirhizosphaerae TaxID=2987519 RepID=A0ABT9FMZ7_9BACL|nr:stage II sporulation protein R [Paenibacillus sp. P96]MDP4096108.1 stage II sporulation protein R [Paenibacillus sp. P96]